MTTAVALRGHRSHRPGLVRLAILIGIAGVVVGTALAASSLYQAWRAPDSFDRTAVGAALAVRLDGGQRMVVYDESASTHQLGDLVLTITSPTGSAVPLKPYQGTLEYDRNGVVARALGSFTATEAGTYRIGSAGDGVGTLAVGGDLVDVAVDGLARGAQIALVALVVALAIGTFGRSDRYSGESGAAIE